MAVLANPISPESLFDRFGAWVLLGVALILFAECGLLVGFFLPGDTLLFAVGLKLAIGGLNHFPIPVALLLLPASAILGNVVGYWIGQKAGPKVFDRPNSRLFQPEFVTRSQEFFDRFGTLTIIVARFVPIVRTVATVMAGVANMRFAPYLLFSTIGGVVWADGVMLGGYWLGKFDFVQRTIGPNIDYVILAAVILSFLPTAVHWWTGRKRV